jgi:hypothetical protein
LANLTSSTIYPLGLNVTLNGDGDLCAEIIAPDTTMALYPIARLENWVNKAKTYYSTEGNALLYILAILFLVISVVGAAATSLALYQRIMAPATFHIQQFTVVFFTFSFNLGT